MKQEEYVSNFIAVKAIKAPKTAPTAAYRCEVVAVAPARAGAEKSPRFALGKEFADFQPLAQKLSGTKELSTAAGATCLVRFAGASGGSRGATHVLFVGTGTEKKGVDALGPTERLRRLGASVQQGLAAAGVASAAIHLDSFLAPASGLATDSADAAYAFVEGMGLAAYRFRKYFTKKEEEKTEPLSVTLLTAQPARVNAFAKGIQHAYAMLAGAYLCRDLGNEPSNALNPAQFAARVSQAAASYGLKCVVFDEKALEKERMGLILGVGQGSANPPRVAVLEYNPPKKPRRTIAFVGKGITFDSGGISIKPSAKMEEMKHDMCGAAAAVGAMVSAAALKVPARILAVIACAENMPGGRAIQPGNILRARSGKTVEIINTDAEGRLVLADALDYIQDAKPDMIVDLATLTGAITITLGKVCAGLMSNNTGLASAIKDAARRSGERVWELPLFEEYFEDLKSEYADLRNHGDSPANGSERAAMFLKSFVRDGTRWAHLDIAAVAMGVSHLPYVPKKSSTGYGVRLLVELAKKLG